MIKRFSPIIAAGLVLSLIFTGCGKKNTAIPADDKTYEKETASEQDEPDTGLDEHEPDEESETPEESEDVTVSETDYALIAERLKEKYDTENVFRDVLIPPQFVLVTESEVTGVLVLGKLEQETSIPLASVSNIKTSAIDSFVKVKITDMSGKEITVNLSPEDADFLSLLMSRGNE